MTGLRVGDDRLDLHLERTESGQAVTLTSRAAVAYTVALRWDALDGREASIRVDGAPVEASRLAARQRFGMTSVALPDLRLPPGAALRVDFDPVDGPTLK